MVDWSKLEAFADDKKGESKLKFVFERIENIVGEGEKRLTKIFTFPVIFLKDFKVVKSRDCVG